MYRMERVCFIEWRIFCALSWSSSIEKISIEMIRANAWNIEWVVPCFLYYYYVLGVVYPELYTTHSYEDECVRICVFELD